MKYTCYTLDNASWKLRRSDFLSDSATALLDECEVDVYDQWKASFPAHKSLSPIVNSAILDRLEGSGTVIDPNKIQNFRILRAFNNSKYSGDTCLQVFENFKCNNGAEIVLFIPSAEFKKKFCLDSTYMTIEKFPDYYVNFVKVMEPKRIPVIHFIALQDLAFETTTYQKGEKAYIKLIYGESN